MTTKSELFEEDLQVQARLFKALSHPARLAILLYLAEIKTCITGNIAEEIPLSRTTVNQHLKELKDADLINGTTQGAKTNYCINPAAIKLLKQTTDEYFKKIIVEKVYC